MIHKTGAVLGNKPINQQRIGRIFQQNRKQYV